LRVTGKFLGQKFERDQTVKPRIFGVVDHAHTAAQPFANHCQGMLRGENLKVGWNQTLLVCGDYLLPGWNSPRLENCRKGHSPLLDALGAALADAAVAASEFQSAGAG
jgi:hypothetical protein